MWITKDDVVVEYLGKSEQAGATKITPNSIQIMRDEYKNRQSDLRTLAEAVVALDAHKGPVQACDYDSRTQEQHAPAITLAQGILEGVE